MYVSAIFLAAGKGARFDLKIPKPLALIKSKPVISYSLKTLNQHPDIKDIIVVVNRGNQKDILDKIKEYRIDKVRQVVRGGKRRQDSVACGLKAIDSRTELVLIHDGARPFVEAKVITSAIKEAKKIGAAVVGVPVKATIKRVTRSPGHQVTSAPMVKETLKRNELWEIQTPQVFRKELIVRAFKRFGKQDVTDDAMLVEKLGKKVKVVEGSYNNIKITTPEDLIIAEAILKMKN